MLCPSGPLPLIYAAYLFTARALTEAPLAGEEGGIPAVPAGEEAMLLRPAEEISLHPEEELPPGPEKLLLPVLRPEAELPLPEEKLLLPEEFLPSAERLFP